MSQEYAIYAKDYGEGLWAVMETYNDVEEFISWLRVYMIDYDIVTAEYRRP